jgi:hypothetical protein
MDQRAPRRYDVQYGPDHEDTIWARVARPNLAVFGIIAACVAAFAWELTGANLAWVVMDPVHPFPWMFVTSMFLHGGFEHIFFNLLMLFMFGMTLERMIGSGRFLSLFLVAGIVGNIGYVLFSLATGDDTPAIGASGAIYGVFACLAILAPDIRVYLFFFIPLRIIHALVLYAIVDVLFLNANDSVAHAAHLAGLAVGLLYAAYLRRKLTDARRYGVSYTFESGP